jgi:hypothetical protein
VPHRIIAILLMLSLSYQAFIKLGIVIWFECNRDYIAKNLCENRAQPEKKCCGKCYLNKQMRKADPVKKDNNTIPEKWNMGEVAVFTIPTSFQLPFHALPSPANFPRCKEVALPAGFRGAVFRPPSLV